VFRDQSSPAEQGCVGLVDVQLALVGGTELPRTEKKKNKTVLK
jgi:hypothetical protein